MEREHDLVKLPDGWFFLTFNEPFDCFLLAPDTNVERLNGIVHALKWSGCGRLGGGE